MDWENLLKKGNIELNDLPEELQIVCLSSGMMVIFTRMAWFVLAILLVALMLWFGKLMIFLVAIQLMIVLILQRAQKKMLAKVIKKIDSLI